MRHRLAVPAVLAIALLAPAAHGAVVTSVFGGRLPCIERDGVQFCEGSLTTRITTWDDVPLDVNLTLPPSTQDGPFPLIVDLHGYGLGKATLPFVTQALDGYAVLAYSARGFLASCGADAARVPDPTLPDPNVCATRGWVRLADARYEARDTQYLAGLLADEGAVAPDRIGVTGLSYGGGQSMILAALHNRIMLPDGSLAPWKSPGGLDMTIAAAAPLIPWSDLAASLAPNGRTLDFRDLNPYGTRGGVMKQSWLALLYNVGLATGFYAAEGVDPDADLRSWNARFLAGEPYDSDPFLQDVADELTSHHSAYYVDDAVAPAPLLIYNAWTDDLFPANEALRYYRKVRSRHPEAEIALHFADAFGHPRANLTGDTTRIQARVAALFARHLKGAGDPPPAVETYTQACNGAVEEGPFFAADWDGLHPGEVRFTSAAAQRFGSGGGLEANAGALNPVAGGSCRTVPASNDPGAATYLLAAPAGTGYTLMGSPTIVADLTASGSFAEVALRLWDVLPDGSTQTLVAQTFYRPRTDNRNPQVFQLPPNGWRFAAGHVPKLELLGQSVPYGRASTGTFTVTVSNLELRLPVRESPDGAAIQTPAAAVLPPADPETPDLGPPPCGAAPESGCRAGRGGFLAFRDGGAPDAHRLVWQWTKGAATAKADFGDPPGTTGYRLCVYDGSGPVASVAVPAGGECKGRRTAPCWKARRKGFRYRNPDGTPEGALAVLLQEGRGRKARITLDARGGQLGLPTVPLALPVTVQLKNGAACWETLHGSPAKRNSGGVFRDRAD